VSDPEGRSEPVLSRLLRKTAGLAVANRRSVGIASVLVGLVFASVALVGCGGLGMIIAGRLRRAGISVIVMGGAIQVLFGIKGRRWERHDVISKFWGPSWVWPSESETPTGSFKIEGACYWKLGGSAPSTTPR